MYDGVLAIGGNAGPLAGMGMKGGMILVAGKCGIMKNFRMKLFQFLQT